MIQLVEVCELLTASKNVKQRFTLREIYINTKHIISLREDVNFERKLTSIAEGFKCTQPRPHLHSTLGAVSLTPGNSPIYTREQFPILHPGTVPDFTPGNTKKSDLTPGNITSLVLNIDYEEDLGWRRQGASVRRV